MEIVSLENQYYTLAICSSLSIIGSGFIVIYTIYKSQSQAFYSKIVLLISISDIIRSVLFMIPCNLITNEILINLIGILMNSSFLITIIWSSYISVVLHAVIVKSQISYEGNFKYWCIFCFIIVPALNILPCITKSRGISDTLCTLTSDFNGMVWRICLMYFPGWIFILISFFACASVYHEMKRIELDSLRKILVKKLIFYPIVLIVEFLPLTISVILMFANVLNENSLFTVTATSIYSLHGASISVIYAINIDKRRNNRYSIVRKANVITAVIDTKEFDSKNLLFNTFSIQLDEQESK